MEEPIRQKQARLRRLTRRFEDNQMRILRAIEGREYPNVSLQKEYWKYWNSRPGYPKESSLGPLRRADIILGYLRCLRLDQPNILDMGCGMGWFAAHLADFGPTVGIDLSDDAIARARSNFPGVTFRAGNIYDMELPAGYFDVVVSQEVIAHVPEQTAYLEIAARVLKPNGYLIITTVNRFVHFRNEWPPSPQGHIEQWLSRGALKRLLRPYFRVLRKTTAVPMGHGGILRIVNSPRLNFVIGLVFSVEQIQTFKEWAGFGWTQIVLAQKRC